MGRLLIIIGGILVAMGLSWSLLSKIHFLGRLPGDIFIQKKNFSLYFPLTTSLLVSLLISLLMYLFSRR